MTDGLYWNERAETLNGAELEALRLEKLRRQVAYCGATSTFYRDEFRKHGIQAEKIRSLDEWRQLPVLMDKQKVRDLQQESLVRDGHAFGTHLCAPLAEVVNVYSTSGTTGIPTFYCFTAADLRANAEMVKRVMWRTGLRRGDSILWGFGLGGFVATALLPVMTELGVRVIPVGAEAGTARLVQFAKLTRPNVLIGSPSFMLHLIESVPTHTGESVASLGLKRLITGSEPGAGLPDVRKRILEAYQAPLFDFYGPANQFAFVADGADEYAGMTPVASDFGIWDDLVDPVSGASVKVEDGAVGNIILTELEREAAPYLRYAMNDVIEVRYREAPNGPPRPWIRVVGRADDMLIVKGVNVFPAAIQNVVASFAPRVTGTLRIDIDRPPPLVTPPLRLRVEHGAEIQVNALPALSREIEEKIRMMLNVRPKIELVPAGSLGRSVRKTVLVHRTDIPSAG